MPKLNCFMQAAELLLPVISSPPTSQAENRSNTLREGGRDAMANMMSMFPGKHKAALSSAAMVYGVSPSIGTYLPPIVLLPGGSAGKMKLDGVFVVTI